LIIDYVSELPAHNPYQTVSLISFKKYQSPDLKLLCQSKFASNISSGNNWRRHLSHHNILSRQQPKRREI